MAGAHRLHGRNGDDPDSIRRQATTTHLLAQRPREEDLLERVRALSPLIERRCIDIERERAVPAELLSELARAGVLRMAVGADYGGDALALPAVVAVIEQLSAASGSVGWLMGQVALGHVVLGYLPDSALEEIYGDGPDVYVAGAAAPKGRAMRTSDGWQVSGRWPLVSGCEHAAWLYLQCLVAGDEDEGAAADGPPPMRTVVVPASAVRVLRTFRGTGLRGSGSHDAHVSSLRCPDERTCDLTAAPRAHAPILRIGAATQAGLVAAAVMLGSAAGALDAIATLAGQKRPAFSTRRLAESPLFANALGEASMTLAAARALLYEEVTAADADAAIRRASPAPVDEARLRAVGTKVAELAAGVVDVAYTLGGSSSVVEGSPLERRLSDARSLTQHATLSRDHLARFGAALVRAHMAGAAAVPA